MNRTTEAADLSRLMTDMLGVEAGALGPDVGRDVLAVEARLGLLRRFDELLVLALSVGAVLAFLAGFFSGWQWGVLLGLATAAAVGGLRLRAHRASRSVVPWPNGTEPITWALYRPALWATAALAALNELEDLDEQTPERAAELLLSNPAIRRGEDGHVLPGQEEVLKEDLRASSDLTRRLSMARSLRSIAGVLEKTAGRASTLVEIEFRGALGGMATRRSVLSQSFGRRAYAHLMQLASSCAGAPALREDLLLSTPGRDVRAIPAVAASTASFESVVRAAQTAAGGVCPDEDHEWDHPGSLLPLLSSGLGALMAASGVVMLFTETGTEQLAGGLLSLGAILLPGTAGKLVKEAASLRSRPAQPTA